MKTRRLSSLATASVLAVSTLLNIALMPLAHAAVQTCDWTGTAGDNKFSTAGNWNNCGAGAPLAGDIIQFSTKNASTVNLINDLGVTLGGVRAVANTTVSPNYSGYHIDTISLSAGASLGVIPGTTCSDYPVGIGFGALNAAGDVTVGTGYGLTNTLLTVAGNLSSELGYIPAAAGSTVAGNVTIASPTPTTSATNCGSGGGASQPGASITGFTIHGLTVQKGASVALADTSYPLTFGGGSGTTAPAISFVGNNDSNFLPVATTYTVSSSITLLDDTVFNPGDKTTVNVTGSISGAGKAITKSQFAAGILNITPSSNTSATQTGILQNPSKTTSITDNQAVSVTVVDNEVTTLDGTRDYVSVLSGGILKGTGTATSGISVSSGGIIAPGHSPGCMNSGNLSMAGTYQAEIGGTTACSGYDQIKVTGTVDVTNGTLEAILYNGFVPTVGQSYTIINNDAADAVTGTFVGIPEGGDYTNTGVTYTVTYKGGDGNDVVLTVKAIDASKLPKAPNTGLKLLTANPVITLLATMIAAGAILVVQKRMQKPAGKRR